MSKLLEQRKSRSVLSLDKVALSVNNMLAKVLNRIHGYSELNALALINCGLIDIKPFEMLEGSPLAQNLVRLDLSNNQIFTVMEICLLSLPLIEEIKLGKNRIADIRCFEWHPWPQLKVLDLNSNAFSSLASLQRFKMPALQDFVLDNNRIDTLCPIGRSAFPAMMKLSLNDVTTADNTKIAHIYFQDENLRKKCFMTI